MKTAVKPRMTAFDHLHPWPSRPVVCRNLVRGVCVLTRKRCRAKSTCLLSTIKED